MKLNWTEQDTGEHTAEYAGLLCEVWKMRGIDDDLWRGDVTIIGSEEYPVSLYWSPERLPLEEMKRRVEDQLASILKRWHDAYEELVK